MRSDRRIADERDFSDSEDDDGGNHLNQADFKKASNITNQRYDEH